MDGDGLSSLGEKGKVKIVVDFVFSFVDQLLTRSLGLEKLPINNKNLFLQMNLVVKEETIYHQAVKQWKHFIVFSSRTVRCTSVCPDLINLGASSC